MTSLRPYRVSLPGTASGADATRKRSGRRVTNVHVICTSEAPWGAIARAERRRGAARVARGRRGARTRGRGASRASSREPRAESRAPSARAGRVRRRAGATRRKKIDCRVLAAAADEAAGRAERAARKRFLPGAPRASSRRQLGSFFLLDRSEGPRRSSAGRSSDSRARPPSGRAMRRERRTSSSSYGQFYAASTERAGDVLTTSAPRDPGFAGTPGRRLLGANGTTIKADAALRAPGPHHRATTTTTPAAANAAVHVRADTVPRVGAFNGLVGRGSAHRERTREAFETPPREECRRPRGHASGHTSPGRRGGSRFGAPSGRYLDDDARRGVVERREALETLEGPSSAPRPRRGDAPPNARSLVEPRGTRGTRDPRGVPSPHERRDSEKPSPGTGSSRAPRESSRGNHPARRTLLKTRKTWTIPAAKAPTTIPTAPEG